MQAALKNPSTGLPRAGEYADPFNDLFSGSSESVSIRPVLTRGA